MKKLMWILLIVGIITGLQAQTNLNEITTTVLNCQQPTNRSSFMDWGDGVTGSVDVGTGVAGGTGYGSGLPNEEMLECVVNGFPGQVGYWFTLTIDDSAPVDLTICMDGLGYRPTALAYWVNDEWNYRDLRWQWIDGCVPVPIDPNYSRTNIDIPIVFSSYQDIGDYALIGIEGFNNNCYEDGDSVEMTIHARAWSGPCFDVIVVTKLLDANYATIDSTFRLLSIGDKDTLFTEILTIPVGVQSPWLAQTEMYHIHFFYCWLEAWHTLQIEDCTPNQQDAWIRYVETQPSYFFPGDDVEVTIEVDTELSEQDIRVETILLDANYATIDSSYRYLTILEEQDDPITEILTIPYFSPEPEQWLCQVSVYDDSTNIQQDIMIVELPKDFPVPVTLSSFTAVYDNSTPTLHWTTQSESNNLGWNIYRSLSENMGQANQINDLLIPGNGTTTEPTDYVYNDLSDVVSNTTYWYWLESASYNGETELSGPVTLTIQDDENQLPELPTASVLHNNYPNPFNPHTTISFSINQGESGSLTIYNIKGQLMESVDYEAGNYKYNWDATPYTSGIYFYRLETRNYTNIKKMIMVK